MKYTGMPHMPIQLAVLTWLVFLLFTHPVDGIAANRLYDKRFQERLEKAVSGDRRAQYRLGLLYLRGNEVKKDLKKARIWLEKAAEQGYAKAFYRLGMLHVSKRYGMYNPAKAFAYFRKGAAKKHAESQYSLALAYYKGTGTAQDKTKALYWARQAKKNKVHKAAVLLQKLQQPQTADTGNHEGTRKPAVKKIAADDKPAKPRTKKQPGAMFADSSKARNRVFSGLWMQDGKPAKYLPSGLNRCHVAGPVITCTSKKLRKSTDGYRSVYRVRTVLSGFAKDGSFKATYRINYLSVSPKKKTGRQPGQDESDIPTPGWHDESTMRCKILGFYNLRCYTQDLQVRRYLRLNKKF